MDDPLYLSRDSVRLGFLSLFLAHKSLEQQLKPLLRQVDIPLSHYKILLCLSHHQPISKGELQKLLKMQKQALYAALNILLAKNYIVQNINIRDKRMHLLRLTNQGEAVFNHVFNQMIPIMQQVFQISGQQAVQGYKQVMAKIVEI